MHDADIKIPARQDVELVFASAAELLANSPGRVFDEARAALVDPRLTPDARLRVAHDPRLTAAIAAHPVQSLLTESPTLTLGSSGSGRLWARGTSSSPARRAPSRQDGVDVSGTFRTAAERLPEVAAMGFDVVYLPPIHPIGASSARARTTRSTPGPTTPAARGRSARPRAATTRSIRDLGTSTDFESFVAKAAEHGLEVALDLALQAHPTTRG